MTLTGVLVPTYRDGTSVTLPFELNVAPDWKGPSELPKWPLWMGGASLLLVVAGLLFLRSRDRPPPVRPRGCMRRTTFRALPPGE